MRSKSHTMVYQCYLPGKFLGMLQQVKGSGWNDCRNNQRHNIPTKQIPYTWYTVNFKPPLSTPRTLFLLDLATPCARVAIDPFHKWSLNLNNNTLYFLSLVLMFPYKGFFTWMWGLGCKSIYSDLSSIYAKGLCLSLNTSSNTLPILFPHLCFLPTAFPPTYSCHIPLHKTCNIPFQLYSYTSL